MSQFEVILWDVDGTLMDFLTAEKAAICSLFREFGLGECTDEMVCRYSRINKRYWEKLELGEMTKSQILVGRFKEFFEVRDWMSHWEKVSMRLIRHALAIPSHFAITVRRL